MITQRRDALSEKEVNQKENSCLKNDFILELGDTLS